LILIK